jgi:hypothetical protein
MTGLATGPHLDFRIELRGQFLNFEKLPLPPSDPVSRQDFAAFAAQRDHAFAEMPPLAGDRPALAQNPPQSGASVGR